MSSLSINYIQKFLLYLMPISIVLSSFVADLSLVIISILFLTRLINKEVFKNYYQNKFFLFFIFWCIYLIFSSLLSENIYLSLESSLFYFRFGIFSLAVFYLLNKYQYLENNFSLMIGVVLLVVILDALFSFFYGYNLLGYKYNNYRLSGFFDDEWVLGSFLVRLFPLALISFPYFKNKNISNYILIIALILLDITVILSGERVACFYLILFNLIFIFLIAKLQKILLIKNLFSILFITLLLIIYPSKKERLIDFTIEQMNLIGSKIIIVSPQHQSHYITAWEMIKNKPFFGYGPKSFRLICAKDEFKHIEGCSTHPHNTYMQLFAETGIVGLLPVLFVFIFINLIFIKQLFYRIYKNQSYYKSNYLIILSCIYISLWPLAPAGNFFHNWLSIIYYLPIGFFLFYFKNKNYINKNI